MTAGDDSLTSPRCRSPLEQTKTISLGCPALLAISFFDKITFETSHYAGMLKDRIMGLAPEAFAFSSDTASQLTPGKYLSGPGALVRIDFSRRDSSSPRSGAPLSGPTVISVRTNE